MTSRDSSDKHSTKEPIIAGAVAGVVSRFCIAPLDVVKIRLQLQPQLINSTPAIGNVSATTGTAGAVNARSVVYRGALGTMKTIVQEEGLTALWKGNIPAELLYLTYGATQFFAYAQCKELISNTSIPIPIPPAFVNTIAGGMAGGIATSITYPLDLLRTRFAASKARGSGKGVYKGLSAAIREIYKDEGMKGFYRGGFAAVVQIVPYMGLFFGAYEGIKTGITASLPLLGDVSLQHPHIFGPGSVDVVSGTLGGIFAKTGVFPLDTIRKRLQVQGPTRNLYVHGDIPVYEGILRCGTDVVKREGWRGLYRGLTVSLVKAAPASAVTMWTYGRAAEAVRWWEGREKRSDL